MVEFSLVCLTKARSVLKRLSVWYRPVRGQSWIFSMHAVVAGFCLSICPCNLCPSSCECLFENNLRLDTVGMDMVRGEKTRDGLAWLDLLNAELSLGAKPRLSWRGPTEIPGDGERGRHYYAVTTRMAPAQTAKTGFVGSRFDVSLIVKGEVIRLSTNQSRSGVEPRSFCLSRHTAARSNRLTRRNRNEGGMKRYII